MNRYDLAIIGGGPGGYSAAVRAAQLHMKVCVIEKRWLGGTCLNTGCIPTKALYRSAQVFNELKNSQEYGIESRDVKLNIDKVIERKDAIVSQLVQGVEQLMNSNSIDVYLGNATFKDPNTISVQDETNKNVSIYADKIIIATGSHPGKISISGTDLPTVMTSNEILDLRSVPSELVIVGGGVIGIEFANIFSSFGSKVTVLEFLPQVLTTLDKELRIRLITIMKKNNIKVHTSTEVKAISSYGSSLMVKAETKRGEIDISADNVLISTGRVPNTDGLNLETVNIKYGNKGIEVNDDKQTSVPGIYAIGDVTGGTMLAHVAASDGVSAVESIAGISRSKKNKLVPACIFSFPEVAYAGMTEDEAKELGIDYNVGKFMFGANGKALTLGESGGLVKVISDKDEKLIGVHILGPHASDTIHEGALAIEMGLEESDIREMIHAHPTLSEAFHEAVLDMRGCSINKIKQKR